MTELSLPGLRIGGNPPSTESDAKAGAMLS
jgi:hypothetical protein